ncbi:hypothetical protein [uncultured Vagococcus sp.]|nr:hypothetical protein [uncultured Vagococcus sp.]
MQVELYILLKAYEYGLIPDSSTMNLNKNNGHHYRQQMQKK